MRIELARRVHDPALAPLRSSLAFAFGRSCRRLTPHLLRPAGVGRRGAAVDRAQRAVAAPVAEPGGVGPPVAGVRRAGDRLPERLHLDLGSPEVARYRDLALPIYEELGDLVGQGNVLNNLGIVLT